MPKPALAAATIAAAVLAVAPAVLPGGGAAAAPEPSAVTRTLELRGTREAMQQGLLPAPVPLSPAAARNGRAAQVALRYLGTPYAYGGSSPAGFDCSGLVAFAYGRVGVTLPHSSYALWDALPRVGRALLLPGDLVFFNGLGHVGIYVGGGRYVHAPHSGEVVEVARLGARDDYLGAVRA
jgi:cell wall-associated NlpC family hydrolase